MDKLLSIIFLKEIVYTLDNEKKESFVNFFSKYLKLERVNDLIIFHFKDNLYTVKENKFLFYIDEKDDTKKIKIIIYPTKLSLIQLRLIIFIILINSILLVIIGKGIVPFFILLNLCFLVAYFYFISKKKTTILKFKELIKEFPPL